MKVKQIKELITKLGYKEQQELIKRFGNVLPKDEFVQLDTYYHLFSCDKCGEFGHLTPDFKACPKCGNTNFRNYSGRYAHIEYSNRVVIGIIKYEVDGVTAQKICQISTLNQWATDRDIEKIYPTTSCLGYVLTDRASKKTVSEKWNSIESIMLPRLYRSNGVEYELLSLRWDGNTYVPDENDENDFIYSRLRGSKALTADVLINRSNQAKWLGMEPYIDHTASLEFRENATVDQYGLTVGEGVCGKCGNKFIARTSYEVTLCPHCGTKFKSHFFDDKGDYHVSSFLDVNTGNLQILLFRCIEIYREEKKEPYSDSRYLAEITEKGKVSWYKFIMGEYCKCPSEDLRTVKVDNLDSITSALDMFEGTKFTGWNEFKGHSKNVVNYLALISEHPEVEKLVKGGFIGAVKAMEMHGYPQKLSQFTPTKSLRKLLSSAYPGTDLNALVECYARDNSLDYETFLKVEQRWRNAIDIFRVKIPSISWAEIVKYLDYVDQFQACPPHEALQLWADYLKMYKMLGGDLTDRRAVYPNSLKREHDKASRKVQLIHDETKMARFDEVVKDENYKKLAYENDNAKYRVLVPQTAEEMFEEGRQLSHCVGAYVDDVADKRCKILFVRKQSDISKSLATMEVRGNSIVQLRGYANHRPSNEVISFARDYAAEKSLLWCV